MRRCCFIILSLFNYFIATMSMAANAVNYDVVPMPQQVALQQGEPFVLNSSVQILAPEGLQQEAEFLQSYLQEQTGLSLTISQKREKKVACIELTLSTKAQGAEGYMLTVNKKGITIAGGSAAGPCAQPAPGQASLAGREFLLRIGQ